MQERKYRGIGWHVSEKGKKFENFFPGLGFFFREGEKFTVTPFMDYPKVIEAIKLRRQQLRSFGKAGTTVFDIESDHFEKDGIFADDAY